VFKTMKIKDLGRVVTGSTPPTKNPKNFGKGYPFIKPPDLFEDFRSVLLTETEISLDGFTTQSNRLIPANSPCVVCIGTIGKIGLTTRPSFTNQQINSVIVDPERFDPLFVFYLLRTTIPKVKQLNAGSASGRENVNKSTFENIEVEVPSLIIQRRIAYILSAYDDLIENNTRRIAILEEMARRIYEEWFVHFRFPGHEQVQMVESEFGLIPEGWAIGCLDDILENIRVATRPGQHLSSRRYVTIDCISKKSLVLLEHKSYEEAQSSLVLFEKGDILFGAMRPYFHKVAIAPYAGITRTTCFVLRPRKTFCRAFGTLLMLSDSVIAYATAHTQGATIPYAVWDGSLAKYKMAIPPEYLLIEFESNLRPILEWLQTVAFKQENLRTTRDLLLPKLISGELDVSKMPEPETIEIT